MNDDQTPINARPTRRRREAFEDLSLALRDRVLWPAEDYFRSFSDAGRAAVAGGAVVLALGLAVGGYSLAASGGNETAPAPQVAVTSAPAPKPAPVKAAPKPEAEPTLQGATPVFKAPVEDSGKVDGSKAVASEAPVATTANTGNPATDTFSTNPAAQPAAGATASAAASVDGPPAGPAAIAVARKFAGAFVVYETGAEKSAVRKAFKATAVPDVTKALLQRPPRQPAGVKVPKAKVLNVVPAPSHDRIYPVSVSLLRVGTTSELRLEMEQLKNKQWRVVNVLG
ncbi:MAG TPA: hypothetical protein VNC15_01045 [Solirubrobacterales bacterium]|jgi:hypothetical protein|nr:hypothetical protein [Solirubrobacterales bacterium]